MNNTQTTIEQIQSWVAPRDYTNPTPKKKYDLVVLGGGTAGLIAALGAHALGASVALVESSHMGGDCLNTGCVPSKGLIEIAKKYHAAKELMRGVGQSIVMDTSSWIQYAQEARKKIAPHDAVSRFVDMGLDVFLSRASFVSANQISLASGEMIAFRKAAICTGASPRLIDIQGLDSKDILTSESVFQLEALPKNLLVIGSGPIGCELAQAFSRLGTKVSMVTTADKLFEHHDPMVGSIMHDVFDQEGIEVYYASSVQEVLTRGGKKTAVVQSTAGQTHVLYDQVLMAVGRLPNTAELRLDRAGIKADSNGIDVDAYLRTSQKHIFASGDVTGKAMFTHHADAQSRVLVQNACTPILKKAIFSIPMVTYTQPEIATVFAPGKGRLTKGLQKNRMTFEQVDRAIIKEVSQGLMLIYTNGKGVVQGAELVHPLAGELLPQVQLAIKHQMKLSDFSSMVYAYPTESEILRKMGDQARAQKFTPRLQKISRWMVKWL